MTRTNEHRIARRIATLAFVSLFLTFSARADTPPAKPDKDASPAPASSPAPDGPPKNTLKWKTASEVNNFGYDVYRGENGEDGKFERITKEPIAGKGTTDTPSSYQYVDDKIDPKKTYWYYVESISTDGRRERFTPIVKKEPKGAAPAEPAKPDAAKAPATQP
ncbi:MAG: hypothetical protein U0166_07055 [Acidobacteriota bacterium]